MHPDDGLNAGAATFTPGGGRGGGGGNVAVAPSEPDVQPDDYYYTYAGEDEQDDDDDEAWMEEIHNEMEGNYSPPYQRQQVLPPHAEEFWFPECRNCTCCHGYKHGCGCCITQGMQSCSCVIRGGNPSTMAVPSHPTTNTTTSSVPTPKQKKQTPLCKFFTSPGGCRFGDKCRFAHS